MYILLLNNNVFPNDVGQSGRCPGEALDAVSVALGV
jgi:hypothetical protein